MKLIFSIFMIGCVSFMGGYGVGRNIAFEDIIGEKCWLNETSQDIECISYIKK